jgi:ketosteroid isomerase-like protein
MSRGNVELQRLAVEAWSRGDIDAFLSLCHPEFEWHPGAGFPGLDVVYRGHDGFRKFERDFRGPWESVTITLDEVRGEGDRVAARATFDAVGRDRVRVRSPIAWVATYRDALVVRVDTFADWTSALDALA